MASQHTVSIKCTPKNLPESESILITAPRDMLWVKEEGTIFGYRLAEKSYLASEIDKFQFFLHGHNLVETPQFIKAEHVNSQAKDQVCFTIKDIALEVWDEENKGNRYAANECYLEIATPSFLSDEIKGKITFPTGTKMQSPKWVLSDQSGVISEQEGENFSYAATASKSSLLWPPLFPVKEYVLDCEGKKVTIKVYNSDKIEFDMDLSTIYADLNRTKEILRMALPTFDWEGPKGTFHFESSLKEHPQYNYVNWTYKVNAGINPLIKAWGRFPIGPMPPPHIQKWIMFGGYIKIEFDSKFVGQVEVNEYGLMQGGLILEGSLNGSVGADLKVFSPNVISADISANVGGKISSELKIKREGVFLDGFKSTFSGVKLKMKFTTLGGKIKFNRDWSIVDESTAVRGSVPLYTW